MPHAHRRASSGTRPVLSRGRDTRLHELENDGDSQDASMGEFTSSPGLIAGLTTGFTKLTLDFASMMLITYVALQGSHTKESLDALAEMIMSVCIHLSRFIITIDTYRNKERLEDQEDLALPITDMQ